MWAPPVLPWAFHGCCPCPGAAPGPPPVTAPSSTQRPGSGVQEPCPSGHPQRAHPEPPHPKCPARAPRQPGPMAQGSPRHCQPHAVVSPRAPRGPAPHQRRHFGTRWLTAAQNVSVTPWQRAKDGAELTKTGGRFRGLLEGCTPLHSQPCAAEPGAAFPLGLVRPLGPGCCVSKRGGGSVPWARTARAICGCSASPMGRAGGRTRGPPMPSGAQWGPPQAPGLRVPPSMPCALGSP